jgi:hypothetical protein
MRSYVHSYKYLKDGSDRSPLRGCAADGIKPVNEFEVDRLGPDEQRRTPAPSRGLVDWMRLCPNDGWFVEIKSESTDSLPPARRSGS